MSTSSDLHVVLGASGAVGRAVGRELLTRGQRVRAVNRDNRTPHPSGVEVHRGDIRTVAGATAACAGAAVVYHCTNPGYDRWTQEFPSMTRSILAGAAAADAKLVFADAALNGKTARWIGPLDIPHTVSYLPDIAAGLVTLGERPQANGRAWHLPAAEPVTGRRFLELVFAALDRPAKIAGLGRGMQRVLALVNPTVRELGETWYQRDRPFTVDATQYQKAFGPSTTTPHAQGIKDTLDWFRREGNNIPRS